LNHRALLLQKDTNPRQGAPEWLFPGSPFQDTSSGRSSEMAARQLESALSGEGFAEGGGGSATHRRAILRFWRVWLLRIVYQLPGPGPLHPRADRARHRVGLSPAADRGPRPAGGSRSPIRRGRGSRRSDVGLEPRRRMADGPAHRNVGRGTPYVRTLIEMSRRPVPVR